MSEKITPKAGDVLEYVGATHFGSSLHLIVLILDRRDYNNNISEVDVLWLLGHTNAATSTHSGSSQSWEGWVKLL